MQKYQLTPEHAAQLKPWADKWIANAMSTEPMTDSERAICERAVRGMYAAAELPPPTAGVLYVSSPQTAAISACIGLMARWLLAHPDSEARGGATDDEVLAAIPAACVTAVCAGMGAEAGETEVAIADAIGAAMATATRRADGAGTWPQRDVSDGPLVSTLLKACKWWWRLNNGGCHWSAHVAWISFFRHIVNLPLDYSAWHHYEELAIHSASRMVHADVCVISDRPEILRVDEQRRPHCEDGPSHRWRDGWERYYWHGVSVPRHWILGKATLTPSEVLRVENVEQRRAGCEILEWRVLDELGAVIVDQDENPMVGTLYRCDLPGSPGEQFLKALCGTGRECILPVPPTMRTALEANAWTYGVDAADVRALEARS